MTQSHEQLVDRSQYQPLVHHGNTLAAWVGSSIALVGFIVAGVAFILPGGINWAVMWVGFAIVGVSAVVGLVMRNMGYGATDHKLVAPRGER